MKVVYTPYKPPTYTPNTMPPASINWLTRKKVFPTSSLRHPHREHCWC